MQWARKHEPDLGLRLAVSLSRFWEDRGHWAEGSRWLSELLERDQGGDPALRARALLAAGNLAEIQGDVPAARALLQGSWNLRRETGD